MDAAGLFVFVIGIILRFIDYERFQNEGTGSLCPMTFDQEETIRAAHMCYCISFSILMIRSINFFAISRRLGPKVLMLAKMFNDMAQFLLLMVVFLAAYGIATQATPSDYLLSTMMHVHML